MLVDTGTGFVLITVNTPLLALAAAVGLLGTAVFWLLWFFLFRHPGKPAPQPPPPPPLAWEVIPNSPGSDLFISDKALELRGPDYRLIGSMPANFACSLCHAPEDISLKLYLHIPSNSMVVITRHNCSKFEAATRDTIQIPIPMMPAGRRRNGPQTPPAV